MRRQSAEDERAVVVRPYAAQLGDPMQRDERLRQLAAAAAGRDDEVRAAGNGNSAASDLGDGLR